MLHNGSAKSIHHHHHHLLLLLCHRLDSIVAVAPLLSSSTPHITPSFLFASSTLSIPILFNNNIGLDTTDDPRPFPSDIQRTTRAYPLISFLFASPLRDEENGTNLFASGEEGIPHGLMDLQRVLERDRGVEGLVHRIRLLQHVGLEIEGFSDSGLALGGVDDVLLRENCMDSGHGGATLLSWLSEMKTLAVVAGLFGELRDE
ncbi:hypothetical protein Droror1_Dr00002149 [Drosera rotundifolia]